MAESVLALPPIKAAEFKLFADFTESLLGIRLTSDKVVLLESRLARRVRSLNLNSFAEYWEYLSHAPDKHRELEYFIDRITTHKTDFFREPAQFRHLAQVVVPSLASQQKARWKLSVWCAGCSSGEEPYTIAMALSECDCRPSFQFEILATDVSAPILEFARQGIYTDDRITTVPEPFRRKYFRRSLKPESKHVRVAPELRAAISFHQLNFNQPEYPINNLFDVIFFRNVMIYFDRPMKDAVVNKLCRQLKPGGYLFIGASESLSGIQAPLVASGPSAFQKAP